MINSDSIKLALEKIKRHQNSILFVLAVLSFFITLVLVVDTLDLGETSKKSIAEKSIKYLNESVLQEGQTATLISFSEESGLIKIKIRIADRDYDSYVSEDGKLFFPEALNMEEEGSQVVAE